MPTFDRKQYISELWALVAQAKDNLGARDPEAIIYTISIWTDVGVGVSAVNFDTYEHSIAQMEKQNAWLLSRQEMAVARGDLEMAALLAPVVGRNTNPADFAFSVIAECPHSALVDDWNERPEGRRWAMLEPALLEVGELARGWLSDLRLHPEAELAVNGSGDWYKHTWSMGPSPGVA
jgi:hypothetical protein